MCAPAAIALSYFVQLNSATAQPLEDNLQKFTYPKTQRVDVTEKHFDQTMVDIYRWLKNEAPDDHAVAAWIEAQNAVTRKHLDSLPRRETLHKRLRELHDHGRYAVPRKRGDRYFFNVIKGDEDQPSLYAREGVSRALIDPSTLPKVPIDLAASSAVR